MAEDHLLTETELAAAFRTLSDWEVRDNWLRRTYHTPGWSHTMLLANTIGYIVEAAWHHPDLSIGCPDLVEVSGTAWTFHRPPPPRSGAR
jgi:4a-hydroxytetrahydrobiopterin dehydratase